MELKIEKVVKHEKKKNKYIIVLEDGTAYELISEILLKFGLRSGDYIDEQRLSEIFLQGNLLDAKNNALRLLAKRMRTEKEIIDRLKRKGFDEIIIEKTIDSLKRINLINDEDFTERYIKESINLRKPYGKFALNHKLQKLGIHKNMVGEKLSDIVKEDDEKELALSLARKKLNLLSKHDNLKKKQRIASFLAGRGFNWDIIRKVFDELKLGNEE